jgi:hypothetical protein
VRSLALVLVHDAEIASQRAAYLHYGKKGSSKIYRP